MLFGEIVIICARGTRSLLNLLIKHLTDLLALDTPFCDRLVLKSLSDQILGLSALPPVITLDHADPNSSMDTDGGDGAIEAEILMVTAGSMLRASLDVEKVQTFKAE